MCTAIRFVDKNGNMFFGRNLDWTEDFGEKIISTPENFLYKSAFLGDIKSKYSTIGVGIMAENTPLYFDCGNGAGLAIAGLNFPNSSKYEDASVDGKVNIAAYEFPFWVAANFASVDEVERALKNVVIVRKAVNDSYPASLLHWMISDCRRCIVVEYTAKGMQIFHNKLDVLTNEPGFEEQLENYKKNTGYNAEDYSSESRFVRAVQNNASAPIEDAEKDNILRLFRVLTSVSAPDTIYTSVFSSATKTYHKNSPLVGHYAKRNEKPSSFKLG